MLSISRLLALVAAASLSLGCSNEPFEEPHSTLHALCQSGDATPERVQGFLDLGVDVNALRGFDRLTLEEAIGEEGDRLSARERVDLPAIMLAALSCDAKVVEYLIKSGARIDQGDWGSSPLHAAAYSNSPEAVRVLLRAGADVNATDFDGRTPLEWAARENDDPEVLQVLIDAGAAVNAIKHGNTALDHANTDAKRAILRAAGGKTSDELDAEQAAHSAA